MWVSKIPYNKPGLASNGSIRFNFINWSKSTEIDDNLDSTGKHWNIITQYRKFRQIHRITYLLVEPAPLSILYFGRSSRLVFAHLEKIRDQNLFSSKLLTRDRCSLFLTYLSPKPFVKITLMTIFVLSTFNLISFEISFFF